MVNDPTEIILDHLRALRTGQDRIEHELKELKTGQIALRGDFHGLRGDFLRLERERLPPSRSRLTTSTPALN